MDAVIANLVRHEAVETAAGGNGALLVDHPVSCLQSAVYFGTELGVVEYGAVERSHLLVSGHEHSSVTVPDDGIGGVAGHKGVGIACIKCIDLALD